MFKDNSISNSFANPQTQINRVRGQSLQILGLLQHRGGLYTPEIADELGKPRKHVRKYLHNLHSYGCIDRYARWGWAIAPLGVEVLSINSFTYDDAKPITKTKRRVPAPIYEPRKLDLNFFLKQHTLSPDQVIVISALVAHYEKTTRSYLMVKDYFEFAEKVGLSERMDSPDIRDLVISLDEQGFVYMFKKDLYLKIGLLQRVITALQQEVV